MKHLIDPRRAPVGGWRYVDPDTDYKYQQRYKNLDELCDHVKRYRAQNDLEPIHGLKPIIEAWICEQPGMRYQCAKVKEKVARNFRQYMSGAKAYLVAASKGDAAFEDKEWAEKRAEMCVKCPHNVFDTDDDLAKNYSNDFMREQVGDRSTSLDDNLHTCRVCSCILKHKVHYKHRIVSGSLTKKEKEDLPSRELNLEGERFTCWQLEDVR